MIGGSKGDMQNEPVCCSQSLTPTEETATTLTSLSLSNSLPFKLVVEILCRLPVKHLIQLRCVCKSWNSLISRDSEFAKKHLRLSTSNYYRHHLIRITTQSPIELVLCHSPISLVFSSASTISVTQFTYSLGEILNEEAADDCDGASTCDGMVCFRVSESLAVLCNPSIRKFKILPPLEFPYIPLYMLYTLVYDRFINNYKIIALPSNKREVSVHTLGTDYWRRIQDFPVTDYNLRPRLGIFMNDSVNWLVYTGGAALIVSLDLEKESYQKLSPPVVTNGLLILGTLSGCLSLSRSQRDFYDIWIMKEYGNEKSWTKLLCVPRMIEPQRPPSSYVKALYISKDDQVLMEFTHYFNYRLRVYDSKNKTFKIQNNMDDDMMAQEVYVESLISPF